MKRLPRLHLFVLMLVLSLTGCGSSGGGGGDDGPLAGVIPAAGQAYVVFAWNDLGMHCLNPTYDRAVILPPYNTVWAQVVRRGAPPEVVTSGVTLRYRLLNNTYSYGKSTPTADYSLFWVNSLAIFGTLLAHDRGLNLVDASHHNGLAGTMVRMGDHFEANGIPVVPVFDSGVWDPFQTAEITVRDSSTSEILVTTRATVPTSDEIRCDQCHGGGGVGAAFDDLLAKHDADNGTNLSASKPVLCANGSGSCHVSPALGQTGTNYLSLAIHGFHGGLAAPPACYDCHPGSVTRCNRSLRHTAADGNCENCHGSLSQMARSISSGRIPWLQEPQCVTCHVGVAGVDTGLLLYRNAQGHGQIACPACHGSPHAMIPSRVGTDQYTAMQYQGAAKTIGSCGVCHSSSRGEGSAEFPETHGIPNPEQPSACSVCHTAIDGAASRWPHAYQWGNSMP